MKARAFVIAALVTLGALAPIAASAQQYSVFTDTTQLATPDYSNASVPANPGLGVAGN